MIDWYIEQVFAARTWKLRKEVFSPEGKLAEVMLDGDFEATHFAAYDGNEVVGVLSLISSVDAYIIHFLAVAPDLRMKGIGTALLRYARLFVHTFAGKYLLANVTGDQQHFWTSNGFVLLKQHEDTVTYSLSITDDPIH
ncbi:GNAT family N-acetyltransferase [Sphingobacterium paramultivorum]|uniref:GNAT family N-acetyltransferase n=1 Tax=Sphingobacterium paramultivorum TaxID=2886510 RepID=A0A7G5DYF3_9SPHI|nr:MULTISPECIES: GNAT family N-acetyltransferase [Sphingobacterium]MCS4163302.1 GNAT superfamily N-acetyltransferase [Sphingobacterium sp. BIGb0116]QMV66778.1 GNAT family N-acetyltransferase [Sphingobacterium paramultivorum]WSO15604.1 GNAT family N-acetyltransferase [Sphingobacterium paramultivorum]